MVGSKGGEGHGAETRQVNCTLESEKPEGCEVGGEGQGQTRCRFMNIIIA